jgi:beta-lactamase class A
MKMKWEYLPGVIAGVALLVAGSIAATYALTSNYYENLLSQARPIFVPNTPYKLLHPLTGIALPGDQFTHGFPDVRDEIESVVAAEPAGIVTQYSVYLRDLNSGNWTGINEDLRFDPASLLKVVVAIAVYRQAEDQLNFLSTPLTYTSELAQINAQMPFALPSTLKVGQSYSVPFLLKKELSDSDNGAVYTLLNATNESTLDSIYQELSIPKPNATSSVGYKLTTREYSRFFRILYNGTLNIDWKHAEKILEDLTQSTFVSALAAGVPKTILVAHKYGEHVIASGGEATEVELSDCGIVYYPSRPYFLCVMVQGKSQEKAAGVIAHISKLVYQHIRSSN